MTILDFKNPEQEKVQEDYDNPSQKWRRGGEDRRAKESDSEFLGERRRLKGRRTRWLEVISSVIFPRDSKLK